VGKPFQRNRIPIADESLDRLFELQNRGQGF